MPGITYMLQFTHRDRRDIPEVIATAEASGLTVHR